MKQYDPDATVSESKCATDKEKTISTYNLRCLDELIATLEKAIGYHTSGLEESKNKLKELQKVRKLVTPEMEAALAALRSVNIL